MNIGKHLLKTSMAIVALISMGNAASSIITEPPIDKDTMDNDNLIESGITKVDKYIFKGDTVCFYNPCYKQKKKIEKKLGLETAEMIEITNGSCLNFAAKGSAGNVIRVFSRLKAPNSNGISHSGFVVNLDPREIYHTVLDVMPGGKSHTELSLSTKAGRAILREIEETHKAVISATKYPPVKASFAIESYGSAREILNGIAPHVRISDLRQRLLKYKGNIFVRPLYNEVSQEVTLDFMKEYLGRPYESISTMSELLGSVTDSNNNERVENVFCSELVSLFYKKGGVFEDDIVSNNVIPAILSSGADEEDLLKGKAENDIPLKLTFEMFDPIERTKDGDPSSSNSCFYKMILNTLLCCCSQDDGQ